MPARGLNFENQPWRAGLFTSCQIGEPMITRRHLFSAAGGLVAFSATPAVAAEAEPRIGFMEIKRDGTQPSSKGPAEWFTGSVRIDRLFQANRPGMRGSGASVTFEPGARTAWHTHPLGQTLIVTAGSEPSGRAAQSRRSIPATWSGSRRARTTERAAPTTAMTHIAIQEGA